MKDFSPLAITSAVVGFPADIGVITRTDGTVFRFAQSDIAIVMADGSGDTFAVIPGLAVSAVKHTSNGETPSCQIVAVHGDGYTFDSADIDIGLFDGATVQLYKVDRLNLTRKGLFFTGAISNITVDPIGHLVTFDVKSGNPAKILMTAKRQPMCRVDLFSTLCQVNKVSYAVSTTVATIVNAFSFTVTGSLAQADGYFNGGVCVTASGVAFVMGNWVQSTQKISTYSAVNRLLTVGLGLTIYPGCDKTDTITGCGKFTVADPNGNYINFQGDNHYTGPAVAAQQV